MNFDISIILATKNRSALLNEMLSSLKESAKKIRYELIVIDGNSNDSTMEVLKKFNIKKIFDEKAILGSGKHSWPQLYNYGFQQADGNWGMYASDDIIYQENALDNAIEYLNIYNNNIGGGAFFYKNVISEGEWKDFGVDITHGNNVFINYGLIRMDLFKQVNGFDEKFRFYCADGDICLKLVKEGYKILPLPYSKIIHNNIFDESKQKNLIEAEKDIAIYNQKWNLYFPTTKSIQKRVILDEYLKHIKDYEGKKTNNNDIANFTLAEQKAKKLHLGCGERYLTGYTNIDYPPSEHTIQVNPKVDLYADIKELHYEDNSIDEIRNHHVFEHFDRPTALALLCNWFQWLKLGGKLIIETPDLENSIELLIDSKLLFREKQAVLRHLFGSHEAKWAYHYDGWFKEKFENIFNFIGYEIIDIQHTKYELTRNIIVTAIKNKNIPLPILKEKGKQLLRDSMINNSDTEEKLWKIWCDIFEKSLKIAENNQPNISIFIPVYNMEKYLGETLESLLAQTYKLFEIIIADDGSTDNTKKIAEAFATKDSRIKIFSFSHRGEVAARNDALQKISTRSKYILNHDGDDISLPNKLESLVEFLELHHDIDIVGCYAEYFDDEGNYKGKPLLEWDPERIKSTFGNINSMINSASLIRRIVFEKIGNYREEFRSVDDYDFFARALMAGFRLANIPQILHKIRIHPRSVSAINSSKQRELELIIKNRYNKSLTLKPMLDVRNKLNKRLNILHTIEFYYPHIGGAEIVIQQLSERLIKRGHFVSVATSKLPERIVNEINGVNIVEFDIKGSLSNGVVGSDIAKYQNFIAYNPADIMMNYAAQQWATDITFSVIGKIYNNRINIIAPCGYSALKDSKTLRWPNFKQYFNEFIPKVIPLYDSAIYHSTSYQDYQFANEHKFTNSVVIPNGVAEEEFNSNSHINFRQKYKIKNKFMGLCVANYYKDKGHEIIIRSLNEIARTDFTVVFIGKNGEELNYLKKISKNLDVLFLQDISREDTVAAFHQADIFLFGSHIEAFPLVILEAKASKTPFVSTNCGNVKELKGGIVCEENAFGSSINYLLDNDSIRENLGLEGYFEWKEKFTWESIVDKYEELYIRLYYDKFVNQKKSRVDLIQSQLQQNYKDVNSYIQIAKILFNNKHLIEAQNYLEDALELDVNNLEANKLLNLITEQL